MKAVKPSKTNLANTIILSWVLLTIFSSAGLATTIESHFWCNNTDTSTTFYSYLEEPKLQESGYSSGLKTGTFNYFNKGKVTLDDKLLYYDGEFDSLHPPDAEDQNSSVRHNLDVKFDSEEERGDGISEFYAKGFYNNNRAISAWKKVWSDKREGFPSDNITVEANVIMSLKGDYNLKYKATAKNSYLVLSDTAGWSNRTGSRRIDWEQEALMKGKEIKVINDLKLSSLFTPRAGIIGDWLPCCMPSGTIPAIEPIEGEGSEWPRGIKAVLLPEDLKLKNCRTANNCANFSCILTTGEEASSVALGGPITWQDLQKLYTVRVESQCEVRDEYWEYTTNVINFGSVDAENVVLVNTMPPEAKYIKGSSTINGEPVSDPSQITPSVLAWPLGKLLAVSGPAGEKVVTMRLNLGDNDSEDRAEENRVYATYEVGGEQKDTLPAVNSVATLPPERG